MMKPLLEHHIDHKEVSPQILGRSWKIYLTTFDPNGTYLLAEEAHPYVRPNDRMLQGAFQEYQKDHFATHFALNTTIQKGIERARGWRAEWEADPVKLVAEAKAKRGGGFAERPLAHNVHELKERHREQLVRFIAFQMRQLKCGEGKEARVVALCERQIRLQENPYLGVDEDGVAFGPKEQEHQVVLRTLKALAHSLDAHTAYYSPEEAFAMKVQLEKGMCGIGVVMHEGIDGVQVAEMIKGGPADKSGKLLVGDTIVEVDGESVRNYSFQRILEVMRGGEGTEIALGVEREGKVVRLKLKRQKITIDDKRVDVSSEPFGDGVIGKITLHSFYEGEGGVNSEKDMRKAIEQLRKEGPLHGLVLDMRENSGGFLSQAVRVSGLFISSGVVVISKYSDGSMKYYRAVDGTRFYDGPLVVLISRGSASATEIVAQTLQDYGVAVVVGDEQTYGKGTIQHQTVTGERADSFFKVTIGRYYTVSGKSTQIEGVKSDIVVPTDLNFEEIGEGYLEYPLPADRVAAAFEDPLTDIDPYARKWFAKYYVPEIQPRMETWTEKVAQLKANSAKRVEGSRNYQYFIKRARGEEVEGAKIGSNDLQMEESVNIVKDMILLQISN